MRNIDSCRPLKQQALVVAVVLAFSNASDVLAGASFARGRSPSPDAPQTRVVLNCDDAGADSLRDIITNPNSANYAQSGDTVDLSELPTRCGMADSKITLSSGEIVIEQDDLRLLGPDPQQGTVTISAGGNSRIFRHDSPLGTGQLYFRDLTMTEGQYHAQGDAFGGCLYSRASVYLRNTTVSSCAATSDTGRAKGGAVYASGFVTLVSSEISESHAAGSTSQGGGIYGSQVITKYSVVRENSAVGNGFGGGLVARNGILMVGSAVEGNVAGHASGGMAIQVAGDSGSILNSTISGNHAPAASGVGAVILSSGAFTISNTTIAANSEDATSSYAALSIQGNATIESSIVANNMKGASPADLFFHDGYTLSGKNNLVVASNVVDPVVIPLTIDPKLGPLQFNGGPTRTHALLPGSPAIGAGDRDALPVGFVNDQRGEGYPRTTNVQGSLSVDIGAVQFDEIFRDGVDRH